MTNTRLIFALLKFLGHFLLGSFVFLGGLALAFMYYFTSEQVHVVFSFVGPLFVINGIGFLILGIYEFREANKYA